MRQRKRFAGLRAVKAALLREGDKVSQALAHRHIKRDEWIFLATVTA